MLALVGLVYPALLVPVLQADSFKEYSLFKHSKPFGLLENKKADAGQGCIHVLFTCSTLPL